MDARCGCVLFHTNGSLSCRSFLKAGMSTMTSTLVWASTHSSVPQFSGGQLDTLIVTAEDKRQGKKQA